MWAWNSGKISKIGDVDHSFEDGNVTSEDFGGETDLWDDFQQRMFTTITTRDWVEKGKHSLDRGVESNPMLPFCPGDMVRMRPASTSGPKRACWKAFQKLTLFPTAYHNSRYFVFKSVQHHNLPLKKCKNTSKRFFWIGTWLLLVSGRPFVGKGSETKPFHIWRFLHKTPVLSPIQLPTTLPQLPPPPLYLLLFQWHYSLFRATYIFQVTTHY